MGVVLVRGNVDTQRDTEPEARQPCEDGKQRLELCCHQPRTVKADQLPPEARRGKEGLFSGA